MNVKSFWNRVKTRIKEKGLTQAEAAKACKMSYPKLRNWMSKSLVPPLSYAHKLARFLGVSLEYLIDGQGPDKVSMTNEKVLALLKEAEDRLTEIRRSVPH